MFALPLLVFGTCGYVIAPTFRLEERVAVRPRIFRVGIDSLNRGARPRDHYRHRHPATLVRLAPVARSPAPRLVLDGASAALVASGAAFRAALTPSDVSSIGLASSIFIVRLFVIADAAVASFADIGYLTTVTHAVDGAATVWLFLLSFGLVLRKKPLRTSARLLQSV